MHVFLKSLSERYKVVTADFKSVQKKFVDQGADESLVKDYLSKFKALRDKNKLSGDEKNIDLWGKKSFKEFQEVVDKLSEVKTKSEIRRGEAKLIAENEGWKVYEISNHKAAVAYGADTKWCLTQADGRQYNNYRSKNNIYFIISKTLNPRDNPWAKIALLVDTAGKKTYWDVLDKDHSAVPAELKIPNFKVENAAYLIEINGKKYDLMNLPENLKVKGDLYLQDTKITSLPAGLKVGGYLDLYGTKITSLPEGLEVGGYLDLQGTPITKLPAGLKVGRDLNLYDTPITSLPDDLKVEINIYVDDPADIQCSNELRKKLHV